jgi:hypothetical protein
LKVVQYSDVLNSISDLQVAVMVELNDIVVEVSMALIVLHCVVSNQVLRV